MRRLTVLEQLNLENLNPSSIPVDPPSCRQPAEGTLDLSWGT